MEKDIYNIHIFEVTKVTRRLIGDYHDTRTIHELVFNTSSEVKYFAKTIIVKFLKNLFEKEKINVANKEFKVYFYNTNKITIPICYRVVFSETGEMIKCCNLQYDCDKWKTEKREKGE